MVLTPRTALWLVPVAELAGVARHVLDATATGIPGWRVVVLCPPGPLAVELRERGVPVIEGAVSPADGAATAIRSIRRVLRRLRPEVLHTHLAFADIAGATAAQGLRSGTGARIRAVSTEHGIAGVKGLYQVSSAAARVKAGVHRARLLRTDHVIAVSESTREQVLAQWGSGAPVTVVRNGVDAPGRGPTGPTDGAAEGSSARTPGLRVLSLARLAPEKRIDLVLGAFALVVAEHPQAALTVAGTGPEESALAAQAARLGIQDAVSFTGHVDAAAALREHDVVVQLSAWENLSYTLLDAVAHGLGVVATDVGGNREIVPAHCLVDAEDAQAVATAIVSQGTHPEARPQPGGTGQSVQSMCAQIARVYDQGCKGAGA